MSDITDMTEAERLNEIAVILHSVAVQTDDPPVMESFGTTIKRQITPNHLMRIWWLARSGKEGE